MLELQSPELLFNKQKVFHLNVNTETVPTTANLRKAVVVFNQPFETLPAPLKEMLDKLIQACKFTAEETVYINTHLNPDTTLGKIQNEYNPEAVLVFGEVELSRNLTKLKRNLVYELNGVKIVNAEGLDVLVKNDAAKKALWAVLKKMLDL